MNNSKYLASTAIAHPNIALIKYWGNRDETLRLPANGSISMNLGGLTTRTRVQFDDAEPADTLTLNGRSITGEGLRRVSAFLDRVRRLADFTTFAAVSSQNNFPTGAGIASSASAFAALALAASTAAGLSLSQGDLSRLARRGSGSACRSVPGGFVEWQMGSGDEDSFAHSIAPAEHWALADCIAVVSHAHKITSSTLGHAAASSSPLQAARIASAPQRLEACRRALLARDFAALAEVVELDSNLMHAVMITSAPPLFYWQPATLAVLHAIPLWRSEGLAVCYTVDAGPNVHAICPAENAAEVAARLARLRGVRQVLLAHAGGAAALT